MIRRSVGSISLQTHTLNNRKRIKLALSGVKISRYELHEKLRLMLPYTFSGVVATRVFREKRG